MSLPSHLRLIQRTDTYYKRVLTYVLHPHTADLKVILNEYRVDWVVQKTDTLCFVRLNFIKY